MKIITNQEWKKYSCKNDAINRQNQSINNQEECSKIKNNIQNIFYSSSIHEPQYQVITGYNVVF